MLPVWLALLLLLLPVLHLGSCITLKDIRSDDFVRLPSCPASAAAALGHRVDTRRCQN